MIDLEKKTSILVAVSGGVDSIYMLHTLINRGYETLGVAHFDHMIRETSEKDALLVEAEANKYKLPFFAIKENIPEMAKQEKKSLELLARERRRQFFYSIMDEREYTWLALGQHLDDQAETVLYNFIRGSGVRGLAGMKALDEEQKIFRPLFNLSKKEIYEKATELNLTWIEDETNHGEENDRSWLRNIVLPELESRRSGVKKVLANTALRFQELSEFLTLEAQKHVGDWYQIDLGKFKKHVPALQAEILALLWEYHNGSRKDFKQTLVNEVLRWIHGNPEFNSWVYFGSRRLVFHKEKILVD